MGYRRSDRFVVGEASRSESSAKRQGYRRATGPVVVVIEQAPQLRRFLRATLTGQGYRPLEAVTGTEGLLKVSARPPDLVLLDLRIPDMSAVEVIRRLRQWTLVPIIVLSALDDHRVNVAALDAGADDCVSKLLARVRAALRRSASSLRRVASAPFNVGDLVVDVAYRRVTVGGRTFTSRRSSTRS
jgi:two-component system KDP operon response regulator KdpE